MAKRISIINFKGGVGKTTLAFHLGTGFARYHDARVLLVDMDHQSSLSVVCLPGTRWEEKARENLTVDGIFQPFVSDQIALPGTEIIVRNPLAENPFAELRDYAGLDIVPASLQLDETEIKLTASHRGDPIKSDWDKRTYICRWIEETGIDADYDYIIFDCPPATKIVAQNAIAASHGYIIPVVPEAVMVRGTQHLDELVRNGIDAYLKKLSVDENAGLRAMYEPDSRLFGLAVTRIQVAGNAKSGFVRDHTSHLDSLQREWGEKLLKPNIPYGAGVMKSLTDGHPVYDNSGYYSGSWKRDVRDRGIDRCYKKLTAEIKRRIDDA